MVVVMYAGVRLKLNDLVLSGGKFVKPFEQYLTDEELYKHTVFRMLNVTPHRLPVCVLYLYYLP